MREAVIVSTARTPIGKAYRGAFNFTSGQQLGGHAIRHAVARAGLEGPEVEDVIMGNALTQGSTGMNFGRQAAMAAGLIATLTINPLDSVTTVTVQIVTLLIGDTSFDNPKTLAAFALGLMLFIVTLGLNVFALRTVRKYLEIYD